MVQDLSGVGVGVCVSVKGGKENEEQQILQL